MCHCQEEFPGVYQIENEETQRYVLQNGDPIKGNRGDEGGWKAGSGFEAPGVLGSDANYYNCAHYHILHQGDGRYFIENVQTKCYLFQDGEPLKGERGCEGGWLESPKVVGADANYYNRAYWRLLPQGNGCYFIKNVETKRYLFMSGDKMEGNRGDEGGWLKAPPLVGSDANYYKCAYFKITKI